MPTTPSDPTKIAVHAVRVDLIERARDYARREAGYPLSLNLSRLLSLAMDLGTREWENAVNGGRPFPPMRDKRLYGRLGRRDDDHERGSVSFRTERSIATRARNAIWRLQGDPYYLTLGAVLEEGIPLAISKEKERKRRLLGG